MVSVRSLLRRRERRSAAVRPQVGVRDRAAIEQRLKDLETFADSLRRRWLIIGVGAALLSFGHLLEYVGASFPTIGFIVGAAAIANLVLRAVLRRGWYRWWHVYALALFDVALVATLVAFYGPGGFVAGFYIAVLPYTFDQERTVGDFLVLTAALAYITASAVHGRVYETPPRSILDLQASVYLDTVLFIMVALALKRIPARLIQRIRLTRAVVHEAERGGLAVRAPAARSDELGFLDRSLNRMLEETAAAISEVQRGADEVAAFGAGLARSAEKMLATGERVAATAADLRRQATEQRELAGAGSEQHAETAREAHELRDRVLRMEGEGRALVGAAERGRERVSRASETLVTIGEEVHTTAKTVQELSGLSERIGGFAQTIAKIARQTHLLALNAAIEAARAEEHGQGFAAVADQIRGLAMETGRAARDVTELIGEVQASIEAASTAMASGDAKVRDVGRVAEEARSALEEIHVGALTTADLGGVTAGIARGQADHMATLARTMARVADISAETARAVDGAADASRAQIGGMHDLHQTSSRLADVAERLRRTISRFSVMPPEQATTEHPIPPARGA